jgi:hypothetical protein
VVVRSYNEFVEKVNEIGLENIQSISLDHDLGDTAMAEWHRNVYKNYELNYDNITEKTGMDCTKWLVEQWMDGKPVVDVVVHSANAIGSGNMMGYINNYRHINKLPQNCVRVRIEHTIKIMKTNIKEIEDKLENFKAVQYRMGDKGMDYCFEHYSSFEEIEDEEFHKLRNEFLDSMKKIRSYVENKIETLSEEIDDTPWGDY